ncbi:MAG: hypothetical protein HOO06_10910 [Bdellovibrionaceae bacterium]|jgi:chromosome segregation ATPase|nr:hypothetical protein [Pseudobdellovibrionaceae bacterium]
MLEENLPPIPNEIPVQNHTPQVREYASKSSAVESLIHQNEDLLARLSVNIRRYAQSEDRFKKTELDKQRLLKQIGHLHDQILIYKQKDVLRTERTNKEQNLYNDAQQKITLLETQYAELRSENLKTKEQLKKDLHGALKRLRRLDKYTQKISPLAKNLNIELKKAVKELSTVTELKNTAHEKLLEATGHIKELDGRSVEDHKKLTENYEFELKKRNEKVKYSEKEIKNLTNKLVELEEAYEKSIELKNRLVIVERVAKEQKISSQKDLSEIQRELVLFRQDAKAKTIEVKELSDQLERQNGTVHQVTEESEKLKDQVESLQMLWTESQKELEQKNKQIDALQSLNKRISSDLMSKKKDLKSAQSKMDEQKFAGDKSINKLTQSADQAKSIMVKDKEKSEILVNKVENLIAEIQSGF